MVTIVKPQEIKDIAPNSVIIDVRTDVEHQEKCLSVAHFHIPLDKLDPKKFIEENKISSDKQIYMLCRLGGRAKQAAEKFEQAGFNNVSVIEGGIENCATCGYDLKQDKNVMSLERQVRIAVGSLVIVSFIIGFPELALIFGIALVVTGITNWCGMAMLLAKAPWNKK
jgi:rhodanese-related sulfurtransferase